MRRGLRRAWVRLRTFFDRANLVRFLISLILAFALWAWVTAQTDPQITRTIPGVPVQVTNLGGSLTVGGPLPTVQIVVAGPRSRVDTLEFGATQVTVNLQGVSQPGTYTRPVHVSLPSQTSVSSVTPPAITVQVVRTSTQAAGVGGQGVSVPSGAGRSPPPPRAADSRFDPSPIERG